ncbi:MAG: ABC transporter ATP-binding protein [Actinomycetota bacterium]|nr:ABC transporter ATP-binding protein [Actinomycetota bacterium]
MTSTVAPGRTGTVVSVSSLSISTSASDDVVRGVDLELAPGEVVGLVGESGSGKTSLAHALLGYSRRGLHISAGDVVVDGHDLLDASPAQVRALRGSTVSYVPQDPMTALDPGMRIEDQVLEVLAVHGLAGDRDAALEQVHTALASAGFELTERLLGSYPHQLSGGQAQRAAIAMAFVASPKVVVLDEPTTGLDVSTQAHVMATIRRLCAEHHTAAVYVSHDLAVVHTIADRVVVMYAGEVIEVGTDHQIFAEPAHPYTRALVDAIPSPDGRHELIGVPGVPPAPNNRPAGCAFAPRCELVQPECLTTPQVMWPRAGGHEVRCGVIGSGSAVASRERVPVVTGNSTSAGPDGSGEGAEVALRVRGLTASYGSRTVLHDVDLDLPTHRCLALVGESGSGKSTAARCLAGLHTRWEGEVRHGDDLLARSARDRSRQQLRRIQLVFQNPYASLNPRRTVRRTLELALARSGQKPTGSTDRVVDALDSVALGRRFADRYPTQLSGGERQRVAIARALIVEPEILICDEVTSALDVSVQATIVALLRSIADERGLTMVFITHNVGVVRAIADEVAVMQAGRVVEHGACDRVLDHPRHAYTRTLMTDVPRIELDPDRAAS